MTRPLRLLILEDSEDDEVLLLRELARGGWDVDHERVDGPGAMREALARRTWDLVLSDYSMPSFTALDALGVLRDLGLGVPFIVVSGTIGEESAVEAMRAGAVDFIVKDRLSRLGPAIERELREAAARTKAETTRAALEEQLRQSQKMEAVGQLAGGIAHDFNNVLSVILGCAEMICASLTPGEPLFEEIGEIRRASWRAAELTKQLLAFSRKQVLEPKVLDLNQCVAGMETMLRRVLGAGVEVTILPSRDLWAVKADPGQVEQIILNLVVNARDAMSGSGLLVIETKNVELDEEYAHAHHDVQAGSYVQLAVTDNGAGMSEETVARIFEPFFTTKDVGKGTGLGLATVFGIVKQSGGHIWVYSEPGQGTTFKIHLPRVSGDAEACPSEPAVIDASPGTETILLVEDDDQVRAVVRSALRGRGYIVLEAANGGEAVLICEQHAARIHLLLTDVVLPRMSGRQLAERLVTVRPDMRVLFMSGYADDAVAQLGILESAVAYLQKPFSSSTLTHKVRQVLRG